MLKIYLLLSILATCSETKLSCKNMEGKDVDWFTAIKGPASGDPMKGRNFVYFDPTQTGWKWSSTPINSTLSAIGATINQLYLANKENTFTIAYNDDSPLKPANNKNGHSKGVAVFDHDVGFWMIHSVPNFPSINRYEFPSSAKIFAQSFLCLSLSTNNLEEVAEYMRYAQVTPFLHNLPQFHQIIAPSLLDVINKRSLPSSATVFSMTRRIRTLGGKNVIEFSKHAKFEADLWYDLIAPDLKTPMAVETWRNGKGTKIRTKCNRIGVRPNVYNINLVKLPGKSFASTKDHSKWGVSTNETAPVVCIGDVNRQVNHSFR
ncbi:hypothetical protein RB195_009494 [Necator americanus]|uniref:Uncharacterized protein n=1 Tax=Necator americanus TaxID=51031 RepID=A0ABR1CUB1_NECAM